MAEQKHTHDPLNVDEALSTSEAFLLKYKNLLVGIVVAIVVIVCGTLAYKHFIGEPKELKASEALFKGEQYFGNDNYETALKYNSLSKEQAPCFKVKLYSALGDFKEADKNVKLCENQYASRKDKYVLYSAKGYMYLRRKKYDVAYDYLMKSIKKGSGKYIGNKESYLLLARLYEEINELDKARYYYELVIKTDPFNYRAQRGLGLILQNKK